MINIPPIKTTSPGRTELLADVTQTWKVGQILSATTEQGGKPQSNVLIRLGKQLLQAQTPVALENGQAVKLLVKSTGNTQLNQLPLLTIIGSENKAEKTDGQLAATKLRQFIAVQQSFSLLQQSTQTILQQDNIRQLMSSSLLNKLDNLQKSQQLVSNTLDGSQLKQHLHNSGLFLENKLLTHIKQGTQPAKADKVLYNDVKFQLLAIKAELTPLLSTATTAKPAELTTQSLTQLVAYIQQSQHSPQQLVDKLTALLPVTNLGQLTQLIASSNLQISVSEELKLLAQTLLQSIQQQPSAQKDLQQLIQQLRFRLAVTELSQQVENSINKITSMQLQPLTRESDSLVLLLFNLVFKDAHEQFDINFRIQQEESQGEDDDENWKIMLTFNFKTLGKVQSEIHLLNDRVSTVFHTELDSTASKIQPLLPLLKNGLTNAGLQVISLDVNTRLSAENSVVHSSHHILDENA